MGQYLNQKDNRSELQQRLDAQLRAKMAEKSKTGGGDRPDGVDDSAHLEGMKKTTGLAGAWLFVCLLAVVALGIFIWKANSL